MCYLNLNKSTHTLSSKVTYKIYIVDCTIVGFLDFPIQTLISLSQISCMLYATFFSILKKKNQIQISFIQFQRNECDMNFFLAFWMHFPELLWSWNRKRKKKKKRTNSSNMHVYAIVWNHSTLHENVHKGRKQSRASWLGLLRVHWRF